MLSVTRAIESNGSLATERLSHSLPGSPADRRPNFPEVVGSAESLVGRVSNTCVLMSVYTTIFTSRLCNVIDLILTSYLLYKANFLL